MRNYTFVLYILLFLGCQKPEPNDSVKRNKYLVLGNNVNCKTIIYNPSISIMMDSNTIKSDTLHSANAFKRFDIDGDGISDFSIHLWNETFLCSTCLPDHIGWDGGLTFINYSTYQICKEKNNTYFIKQLNVNDTISFNDNWDFSNADTISNNFFDGWHSYADCYMGLRKINNNDTCYGWVHLYYSYFGFIIKDFAIQK
jgi:hypothetical protein